MDTLTNGENPDEMPQNAAFHQWNTDLTFFPVASWAPETV